MPLAVHTAPDEPRLPARKSRFVHKFEVEERMYVRLARGEPDRQRELPRVLRRRDRRHTLVSAVVAT